MDDLKLVRIWGPEKQTKTHCVTRFERMCDKKLDMHTDLHIITIFLILTFGAVTFIYLNYIMKTLCL